VYEYEPGTWGPCQVNERIVPADGWNDPVMKAPAMKANNSHQ
jgi:glucose-6-phosphate 1-dehydrogenase